MLLKNRMENTSGKRKSKYIKVLKEKKMEKENPKRVLTACVCESRVFRFSSTQLVQVVI